MTINEAVDYAIYRVFIGLWDDGPEVTIFDRDGLSWDEASAIVSERLARFRGYDCEVCEAQAAEEFARLQAAEPGDFDAEVEGDEYKIVAVR